MTKQLFNNGRKEGDPTIRTIGYKQFQSILDFSKQHPTDVPEEQWLTFEKGKFRLIDNSNGQCTYVDFDDLDVAITYLKEDAEDGNADKHF